MTLEDLGNLGEFVGALGVVVSLVYLAIQIRQNTSAVRTSTFHEAIRDQSNGIDQLNSDPELNRIWYDGLHHFEALPEDEQRRFATIESSCRVDDDTSLVSSRRSIARPAVRASRAAQPGAAADQLGLLLSQPNLIGFRPESGGAERFRGVAWWAVRDSNPGPSG